MLECGTFDVKILVDDVVADPSPITVTLDPTTTDQQTSVTVPFESVPTDDIEKAGMPNIKVEAFFTAHPQKSYAITVPLTYSLTTSDCSLTTLPDQTNIFTESVQLL